MARELVIVGAGKIGRGVAGMLFARDGWKLHLYDLYAGGMRQLGAQGYYDVRVTDGRDVDDTIRVSEFDIVDSTEPNALVDLISRLDVVACCVYEGAFRSIAGAIAKAVRRRARAGETGQKDASCRPLNVLLCVNALGAPARVRGYVEEALGDDAAVRAYLDSQVGICQVMVLAAGMPSEDGANPWRVVVSANPGFEIDADAWRGAQIEVPGISYVHGAQAHIYRKVYCGNMRHAMAGFMGKRKGLPYICDCNRDPEIRSNIVRAFREAHEAILAEYVGEFDVAEDAEWVAFLDAKLDADTKDPVDRVIDKTAEKLSHDNRFVGPALMCVRHGITPFYLTRGAAYGLRCLAAETGRNPQEAGEIRAFASEVCSLAVEGGVVSCSEEVKPEDTAVSSQSAGGAVGADISADRLVLDLIVAHFEDILDKEKREGVYV